MGGGARKRPELRTAQVRGRLPKSISSGCIRNSAVGDLFFRVSREQRVISAVPVRPGGEGTGADKGRANFALVGIFSLGLGLYLEAMHRSCNSKCVRTVRRVEERREEEWVIDHRK